MGEAIDFDRRITIAFKLLEKTPAGSFPVPSALSGALEKLVPGATQSPRIDVEPKIAALFTTAAVELWIRATHSFLVSAALTKTSPIWASVTGYYSSHYSVRAYAHLLGHFQLFARKKVVHLSIDEGDKFRCNFEQKNKFGREHEFYWRTVKKEEPFKSSQLFTLNERITPTGESDCRHREKANYADHLSGDLPAFNSLREADLKDRLDRLSKIDATVPQIPRADKFPDVDRVQLVAYQRLVHFRRTVDRNVDMKKNRFWKKNRDPQWATNWINFQLPASRNILGELGQQI